MNRWIAIFKSKFGEFWWHSLLLFLAIRVSDLVNAFIGLWLVPKFVPGDELGAVLPLTHFATLLSLPAAIFGLVFLKRLNVLAVNGERGKMKSMLRTVFTAMAVFLVITLVIARCTMTPILERMRIERGSLGILIVATGLTGAIAPVYANALQALKRFNALSVLHILGAPIRLVVALVTMPIRAISGYFVAQSAVSFWQIGISLFSLRKELGAEVRAEPYWNRETLRTFLKCGLFLALLHAQTIAAFVESLVIRQRLPAVDSAAYYMISRFAEIGTYAGATLTAVMFPYVSEAAEKRTGSDHRIILRSTLASLAFGILCAIGFGLVGKWALAWTPGGSAYTAYVPQMVLLTLVVTLFMSLNCYVIGQVAADRFGFLKWYVPLHLLYSGALLFITGYGYFETWLPPGPLNAIRWINRCGLNFILVAMLLLQLAKALFIFIPMIQRHPR